MTGVPGTGRLALLLCAALAFGCAGGDGAAGAKGADGRTALLTTAPEPAGANCAAGGTRVDAGIDADADGVLDPAEVTSTRFVCHGSAGSAGASALVAVTAEAAGANCAAGGTRIDAGLDADADGVLDPAEVTSTRFVCNGAAGSAGTPGAAALVALTAEPAGANCAAGGTRIDAGLDANADGVLDPVEVTSTRYLCQADTRDPAVVSVVPEPGSISSGAVFTVTFSEAMDPATVDGASILLVLPGEGDGGLDEVVPTTVAYDAATHTARLVPVHSLWMWYAYDLRVTSRIRDLAGNALPAFAASYFVEVDGAAPRVDRFTPVDGGVVGPSAAVAVYFDEGLSWASGSQAGIHLVDASGTPVPGWSGWDGWSGVTFAPDAPLLEGQTYTASMDVVVADDAGNWDRVTLSWSFSVDAAALPVMTGSPVASPTSQAPDGLVEITIPVNAAARYGEVSFGDDVTGWALPLGSLWGNENGEGRLTGTFSVPTPPAPGNYSIWVYLRDASGTGESFYAANVAVSRTRYTTWDSVEGTPRESTIPLSFLGVTGGGWVDLVAAVDFVPGASGAGDLSYTIRNLGTSHAGPFVAGLYVNPERVPAPYAVPDYWIDFQGLAAGATVSGTIPVNGLPATVTRVYALADLTASIGESEEANNLAERVHRWTAGATYPNAAAAALLDGGAITSTTLVSGGTVSLAEATVTLNLTHAAAAELVVSLTSPLGTTVTLVANRGSGPNLAGTVLDDLAAIPVGSGAAPFSGTFQPETPLALLAGEDPNGTWTLTVQDAAGGSAGTLDSWSLTIW